MRCHVICPRPALQTTQPLGGHSTKRGDKSYRYNMHTIELRLIKILRCRHYGTVTILGPLDRVIPIYPLSTLLLMVIQNISRPSFSLFSETEWSKLHTCQLQCLSPFRFKFKLGWSWGVCLVLPVKSEMIFANHLLLYIYTKMLNWSITKSSIRHLLTYWK